MSMNAPVYGTAPTPQPCGGWITGSWTPGFKPRQR
jgi:hypothetical protein